MSEDTEHWSRYYEVTVDRPAWETVRKAIELFAAEDASAAGSGVGSVVGSVVGSTPVRFAVDLGCGAGRDARELLRAGWRVLAVDREPIAGETLTRVAGPELGARLTTHVEDLATFTPPACDLVNASLCLPFLAQPSFGAAWQRIVDTLPIGSRFAAMMFGDHDESAGEEGMTCLPPDQFRALLERFEIEYWNEKEEDTKTALGEPHHFHLVEFVARKVR